MSAEYQATSNVSGWSQKKISSYMVGYVLCLVLTFLAFGIVKYSVFNHTLTYSLLALLAITQLVVQAVCFLGLKNDAEGRWNVLPFIFTLLIIFFLVGGSLWIMYNLKVLMMNSYIQF